MASPPQHLPRVAIVGMACRFPGASSSTEFWANLCDGVESITFFDPAARPPAGPGMVGAAAALSDIDLFDADLFGIAQREAELMDPQHRLLLECAWEALEDAGYDPARYPGEIGVFAGANRNTYLLNNLLPTPGLLEPLDGFQISIASDNDYLATRVAHKLDLRGPALTVQCASSTSLVAVHLACRALQSGDCDLALAGGVAVKVPQHAGYRPGGIRSEDGHTRAFDARASGTVFGSGVGIVVLKRLDAALADGDQVRAVVLGSAVSNDGAAKRSYTAPSAAGLSAAIERALAQAGVSPDTMGYLEAHATGTALGDPTEVAALTGVFRRWTSKRGFCAIGSVKTNIGHPSAASGVAGLIKSVLALEHRRIPPSLNFERPHPDIDFDAGPFYVNTELRAWPAVEGVPRRAAVNALGFGGTNAHVVLEEAPPAPPAARPVMPVLLPVSAHTEPALREAADRLADHLGGETRAELADVGFTLQVGRRELPHRLAMVCESATEAAAALRSSEAGGLLTGVVPPSPASVVFMFPGHGSQHVGMTHGLYRSQPLFRDVVDRCAELFAPRIGADLRAVIFPEEAGAAAGARLAETQFIQPALFTVEYALGLLWQAWGVRPAALIGYSIGEYAAACLANVFSLDDAVRIVATRATLAQRLPEGAMLAAAATEAELGPFLDDGLSLAAVSAPRHCILAGPPAQVEAMQGRLTAHGIPCKRLGLARAFHSAMMDPVLGEFRETVAGTVLRAPEVELVSGVTGTRLTAAEATDPEHWVRELRRTVRFGPGIALLAGMPGRIFLEVGPGNLLSALVRGHQAVGREQPVIASCRGERERGPDEAALLTAAARLWLAGCPLEWSRMPQPAGPRRVSLPGIAFQRRRCWVEAGPAAPPAATPRPVGSLGAEARPDHRPGRERPVLPTAYVPPADPVERGVARIWEELLGVGGVGSHDRFFELGGDSLIAMQVISRVRDSFGVELPVSGFLESPTVSALAGMVAETLTHGGVRARHLGDGPGDPLDYAAEGPAFSLFFFSGDESASPGDRYRLVLEAARAADELGLTAVWTPERHFDKFGGLYPNPAVLGAALAVATSRIQIRAGSVVLPLHDPVRVVEEWSVVDNLSHGRVGLAFASGFHPRDFVLAPDRFAQRRQIMRDGIERFRRLWRGEAVPLRSGDGTDRAVRVFPRPVQREPPLWLAATSSSETFIEAGRIGANLLTALLRFGFRELEEGIALYRRTRAEHGHDPAAGTVTLMLHTHLALRADAALAEAGGPLREYLRSHLDFLSPGGAGKGGRLTEPEREALLTHAFQRYSSDHALIGTPESCLPTVRRLRRIGVNEVACLVDFGVEPAAVLEGLRHIGALRDRVTGQALCGGAAV